MFDMIALAYQANMTRVATLMMAAEVSNMTYNQIGVPDAFHPLSHHQNNRAKMAKLVKIQTYHSKRVRALRGQAGEDAGRRRLHAGSFDPALRQQHEQQQRPRPLPAARRDCRRRLRQRFKGNQHVVVPDHTPVANLLLTLLHRAGVDVESVGDSTGEISEI